MVKRLSLVMLLAFVGLGVSGCRFAAPALEEAGGCGRAGGCRGDSKSKAILRQWGQDARKNERFVDNYFLNYDINDPYRGDCVSGY